MTRKKVLENHTVPCSAIDPALIDKSEKFDQIEFLKDVGPTEIEPKCPLRYKFMLMRKGIDCKPAISCYKGI